MAAFGKRCTHKTERNNIYALIVSFRQLVLSDSLTINAIGSGILQRIIWQ